MASLLRNLVERRVPHSVALYIGVSWGLRAVHPLHRERIPPVAALDASCPLDGAAVPADGAHARLVHGRPGRNRFPLTEKIGIPANFVVAAVVLALAFGGTDLGAAVTRVSVENEEGETVERAIPKAEFRKRTALFPFDAGSGLGDDRSWVSYLTLRMLTLDLMPDDFFEPIAGSLHGRIQGAGFRDLRNVPHALKRELAAGGYAEFFVAGAVDYLDGEYQATMTVNRVDTGARIADRRASRKRSRWPGHRANEPRRMPSFRVITSSGERCHRRSPRWTPGSPKRPRSDPRSIWRCRASRTSTPTSPPIAAMPPPRCSTICARGFRCRTRG